MTTNPKILDEEASGWIVRRNRGFSAAEKSEFARWLESDPRHGEAFRAAESTWNALDHLGASQLADEFEAEIDELGARPSPTRMSRLAWFAATGAVAVVAVVCFAWWRQVQRDEHFTGTFATAVGQIQTVDLPDGSQIRLNTDTVVDVEYSRGTRRIALTKGEALFSVAKNHARPFTVQAAGVDVTAVGTAFNIRLRTEGVEVLVTQGKVSVAQETSHESGPALPSPVVQPVAGTTPNVGYLVAGERLVVPRPGPRAADVAVAASPSAIAPVTVPTAEIDRVLAWRDRRLKFDSAPLDEIVAELNRYNTHKIVISDPELAQRRFGGTFEPNDPQTFVALLQASYHLTVEEQNGVTRLSIPK